MKKTLVFVGLGAVSLAWAIAQNRAARTPSSLQFRVQQLRVDNNEGCAVGDIDKDGKLDVVAGEYWYPAPEFKPRKLRRLLPFGKDYLQNNGDHLYDVNGDGWLDVVAGTFTMTKVFWFKNPGAEALAAGDPWKSQLFADTGTGHNEFTYLHDLDGDGVPEWLENSWNDTNPTIAWRITKDDAGNPALKKHVIGESRNGHGMGFGDINGDGREDIVFKQGWYECPRDGPFSGPWKYRDDFALPQAGCPILVVDLDGDKRNDIIWGDGHNYGVYWEQQLEPSADGSTRWKQHLIDKSFSQAHAFAWEEIDNDGRPELITGKRYYAHSGGDPGANDSLVLCYYDWDAAAKKFTRRPIADGAAGKAPGTGLQIRIADLDGNGWKDVVVPGKSGTHIVWNDGFKP